MPPESLKDAVLVEPQLSFSDQLKNAIAPHSSVEGWAAFDCVPNLKLPNKRKYLLRGEQDEKRASIRMRECRRMRDEGRA